MNLYLLSPCHKSWFPCLETEDAWSHSAASCLSWYQDTIGEEGLLSLQSAMCTNNESVQTSRALCDSNERPIHTLCSIYFSFWLRQELRESLCLCGTNFSKSLNLYLSISHRSVLYLSQVSVISFLTYFYRTDAFINCEWPRAIWRMIHNDNLINFLCRLSQPDTGDDQYLIAIILNGQFPIFFSKCELIFSDIFLHNSQEQNRNRISKTHKETRRSILGSVGLTK